MSSTDEIRDRIVAEARRWVGTPFHHQGRTRGLGADCRGLVGGVAVALGLVPPRWWEESFDPRFGGYADQPPPGLLQAACDSFMARTDDARPGDVVVIQFLQWPQHMGILAPYAHGGLSIVHSLHALGVREHRLASSLGARITQAYRFPGVA